MTNVETWPVWLNGAFVPEGAPAISAQDPGFLLGLAVFDTLLCEGGRAMFVEDHMQRLLGGARSLDIELPADFDPRLGVAQVVERLGQRTAAVRLTITPGAPGQGACLVITTRPFAAPSAEGVRVMLATQPKVSGRGLENVKTTGRARNVLALAAARSKGAYEALLLTEEGDVSEGTVSNVFAVRGETLLTPGLERGSLPGIVRGKVLEIARERGLEVREGRMELADLEAADELFLTNSLARVVPVLEVLECRSGLPPGGGPHTRGIRAGLLELEQLDARSARDGAF